MNAAPLLPAAYEGMLPYLSGLHGNPQSLHVWGTEARDAVEAAREEVALLIGAGPDEIYFTASGTESNNWVVKGVSSLFKTKDDHLITSAVEHVSISNPLKTLSAAGFRVTYIPVDRTGRIDTGEFRKSLHTRTLLATVHHAQNEIGTLQPVKEIGELARASNVLFHCDGVASAGLVPVNVRELGTDFFTLSAQSLYGPKGVAALYIKKGRRLDRLLEGGNQEGGKRAGLENVAGIVGLGIAARHARENLASRHTRLKELRDRLVQEVLKGVPKSYLTGDPVHRLPHHASFYFDGIEGEALVLLLAKEGLAGATGSSCLTGTIKPPSVLTALGLSEREARGSLVLTLGYQTTFEEIGEAVSIIKRSVSFLRSMSP